jgi:hypothetical protein
LSIPLQDPSIKQMAEQIANDPSFQGLTSQLQESMAGMMGAMGGAAGAEGAAAGAGAGAGGMPGTQARLQDPRHAQQQNCIVVACA